MTDSPPLSYFDFPAPGSQITILYPRKNRHYFGRDPRRRKPRRMLERTIVVLTVEDGRQIPITIDAFLKRATIDRRRWRVTAFDPFKRGVRTFYIGERCRLQLGLWNPQTNECIELIGEPFEQTAEGLLELKGACEELMKELPLATDPVTAAIYAAA